MADYRGGDAGQSGVGQRAAHNLATGNTPGQRARDLRQKIIMGVAQAGLMGLQGAAKARAGGEHDKAVKDKLAAEAIANVKKQQQGFADVRNSYPGGAEGPKEVTDYGYTPKGGFDGPYQGYGSGKSSIEASKDGLARDDVNKAAASAPVTWGSSKYYTTAGMSDVAANGEVGGNDHQFLKQLAGAKEMESMSAASNSSILDSGPSVGQAHSGGDITRDNPYNVPLGGTEVDSAMQRGPSMGWAPTDEELSGMGQSKRGF